MLDIFLKIRETLEDQSDNRIKTKTILSLNPSSQVCVNPEGKHIGACPRQVWLTKKDVKPSYNNNSINLTSYSGNWFESWFIEQLKNIGVYRDSGFPLTDPPRFVKGIVDCSFIGKEGLEAGEVKSYDGSNYQVASKLLGNMSKPPKPVLKHLLQTFRYSLILQSLIKHNNLFYIDRAGSAWFKNKQFVIDTVELNGKIYPKISTIWKEEYYEYLETEISDVGIYTAEEELIEHFYHNTIPPKAYVEVYDEDFLNIEYEKGEIPEYLYKKYKRDPENNPIGSPGCRYCPYAKGVCSNYEDSQSD